RPRLAEQQRDLLRGELAGDLADVLRGRLPREVRRELVVERLRRELRVVAVAVEPEAEVDRREQVGEAAVAILVAGRDRRRRRAVLAVVVAAREQGRELAIH